LRADGFLSDTEWEARQDAVALAEARHQSALQTLASRQAGGSNYQLLNAQVAAARANLDHALAMLAHTRLNAPIDGRLVQRFAEAGDVVQPGAVLLSLAGTDLNRIELSLNEQQTRLVSLNQSALASVEAYPDQPFTASVHSIGPRIDPQRAILPVSLRIEDPPDYLKADMTASVSIIIAETAASVALPRRVIFMTEDGTPTVLTVENGKVVQKAVTLGLEGDDRVEITQGVSSGDWVVAQPAAVTPGQHAQPTLMASP
jgi:HlyD family secretion protein